MAIDERRPVLGSGEHTRRAQRQDKAAREPIGRRIRSSRAYWAVKRLLKRLAGRELWLRRELRMPMRVDGDWRYAPTLLEPGAIIYSFGVGDSIDFERALIERHGVIVHAFDPTPTTRQWIDRQSLPEGFHFHPWAVAGTDGSLTLYPRTRRKGRRSQTMWTLDPAQADATRAISVPALTPSGAMRALGHADVAMVKLDVEGAEYDAIDALLDRERMPAQLLVEFHHRFPGIGPQRTRASIARLRAAGYRLAAVSTTGRELTFVRPTSCTSR